LIQKERRRPFRFQDFKCPVFEVMQVIYGVVQKVGNFTLLYMQYFNFHKILCCRRIPSVYPMPAIYSKSASHRNFRFGGEANLRSKVKVTGNENVKIIFRGNLRENGCIFITPIQNDHRPIPRRHDRG